METSSLRYEVQRYSPLRQRIEGIVRNSWWNAESVRPERPIPVEDLAWAVASNATILGSITTYMNGDDTKFGEAVDSVSDNDLEYVVLSVGLPRLGL